MLVRCEGSRTVMDRHVRGKLCSRFWMALIVTVTIGRINLPEIPATAEDKPAPSQENVSNAAGDSPVDIDRKPLSFAYVPRDTNWLVTVQMSFLKQSSALKPLADALAKDRYLKKQFGVWPDQIERVVFVRFDDEDGPTSMIFHLVHENAVASTIDTLPIDRVEHVYANQKYYSRQTDEGKTLFIFADGLTVVVAPDEEHMRRLIIAGPRGAAKAKWATELDGVARADILALVNIGKLRSQKVLNGSQFGLAMMFFGLPAEFAPLLEVSTALIAIEVDDDVNVNMRLSPKGFADIQKIHTATKALFDLTQALLTSYRVESSKKGNDEGVAELQLFDLLDEIVERIGLKKADKDDESASGWVFIREHELAKIVENVVPLIGRD